MKSFSPPIRFVVAVLAIWVGFRLATFTPLYPDDRGSAPAPTAEQPQRLARAPHAPAAAHRSPAALPPLPQPGAVASLTPDLSTPLARALTGWRPSPAAARSMIGPPAPRPMSTSHRARLLLAAYAPRMRFPMLARLGTGRRLQRAAAPALAIAETAGPSPWSLVAWSLVRSGAGTPALADGGQLGDSQAGMRLLYRLLGDPNEGVAANARLSRPVRGADGAEAAIGVSLRPSADLPLEIIAERRIAVERGGRDAWAVGVAGGVYDVPLPLDFRLGGYAQAGMVGARSRDLYGDAALSVRRPVLDRGGVTVSVGGGGWAAAQPGASRVDIGPEASLRFPVADSAMRLGVSWRERVAGNAAPGSGPALTLTTSF